MTKSTTIIALDQHAATTVAAVLLPGQRTPALHSLTSDSTTILRLVERLQRQRSGTAQGQNDAVATAGIERLRAHLSSPSQCRTNATLHAVAES